MDIDARLRTVYSATVEERDGEYVIRVPDREVDLETLVPGGQYRVALLAHERGTAAAENARGEENAENAGNTSGEESVESEGDAGDAESTTADSATAEQSHDGNSNRREPRSDHTSPHTPPVAPGDTRRVEIESIGDQGDGIARIDNGYVVIVPDTDVGERVEIEIDSATASVGFAKVTERISYYA